LVFSYNHRFQALREKSKSKSHSGYFEKVRIEEPRVFQLISELKNHQLIKESLITVSFKKEMVVF
jgi:hypothetical protein